MFLFCCSCSARVNSLAFGCCKKSKVHLHWTAQILDLVSLFRCCSATVNSLTVGCCENYQFVSLFLTEDLVSAKVSRQFLFCSSCSATVNSLAFGCCKKSKVHLN